MQVPTDDGAHMAPVFRALKEKPDINRDLGHKRQAQSSRKLVSCWISSRFPHEELQTDCTGTPRQHVATYGVLTDLVPSSPLKLAVG